ncbi:unnamed protein product [Zymoseptoria tritici ST99CH_1A5]|uniref:Uncharacterized protein n=1 Tax=Zymoseptoria tritici ST99CH_1A5 TaxID=1276529 RepID=A0A1Y6LFT7_ZYMTR|nr:unnamed protein product [Zymoseptoria tritici ST99CH_1A5]
MAHSKKKTTATYHTMRERDSVRSEAKSHFKPNTTVRTTSPAVSTEDLPSCADETPIRGPEGSDKAIPAVSQAFYIAADVEGHTDAATVLSTECAEAFVPPRSESFESAQVSKPPPSIQSVPDILPCSSESLKPTSVQRYCLPHRSSGIFSTSSATRQPFAFGAASNLQPQSFVFGNTRADHFIFSHAETRSQQTFASQSSKLWNPHGSVLRSHSLLYHPVEPSTGGRRSFIAEIVHESWLQLQTWHNIYGRCSREFNLQLQTAKVRGIVTDMIADLTHVAEHLNSGTTELGYALGALWTLEKINQMSKEVQDMSVMLGDLGVGKYGALLKEEAGKEVSRVEEALRSFEERRKRLMEIQANDTKRYLAQQATSHMTRPQVALWPAPGSNSLDALRVCTESHIDRPVFAQTRPLGGNGELRLPVLASNEQEVPGGRPTGESGDDMFDGPADLDAASHKLEKLQTEQKVFKVSYAAPEYSSDSSDDTEDWEAEISDSDSENGGMKLV